MFEGTNELKLKKSFTFTFTFIQKKYMYLILFSKYQMDYLPTQDKLSCAR